MKVRSTVIFILVLAIIAAFACVVVFGIPLGIKSFKPLDSISLGLDLTGGVYTVYEADNSGDIEDFNSKIEGTIKVLRNRLDAKGFTEATITRQGENRIRVEIPINETSQIQDPQQISEFIGKPAKLTIVDPDGNIVVEGEEMLSAKPMVLTSGEIVVAFELNDAAAVKFQEATQKCYQYYVDHGSQDAYVQSLDIQIDGETISSPVVKKVISGGSAQIEGNFTQEEAQNLAMQIESGALPLNLSEIEVRSISATLGETALQTSIQAGLIGFIILFLFMIIMYRLCGLVADIALVAYSAIVVFLVALFQVQLTLPGIAGIILGIGMAVDANVVIFERIKEDFIGGKSMRSALKSGFKRAFTAILDSNVTTVIAAIVLAIFGTGSIKGFAYTLAISIVVSFISAILITRGLLSLLIKIFPNGTKLFVPCKEGGAEK